MTTSEIIWTAIIAACPVVSVIVSIIVARRNRDKDTEAKAQELGGFKTDINYIKTGIDDLKASNHRHDEKLDILTERLVKCETNLESHINNKAIHSRATQTRAKVTKGGQ